MIKLPKKSKVFVYQSPIDMRFGFERLSCFVRKNLEVNIDHGDLFIFLGNNRKRLKALYFDGSGLVLITKRMEKTNFMNIKDFDGNLRITQSELELLLHGSVLRKYLPDERTK